MTASTSDIMIGSLLTRAARLSPGTWANAVPARARASKAVRLARVRGDKFICTSNGRKTGRAPNSRTGYSRCADSEGEQLFHERKCQHTGKRGRCADSAAPWQAAQDHS